MQKKMHWRNYLMEFVSIFIAVIAAFALNNWNDNRRDHQAATKILTEINNGLQKDLEDVKINILGHNQGINACRFWRKILLDQAVEVDSVSQYYFNLTRDFFSVQNNSGFETLKSRGLELIRNDSLRFEIISLYEYDFFALKTMEEDYFEMQFQENYFKEFNAIIAPYFEFNERGNIQTIRLPIKITEREKNILLSYLWKIEVNRQFILFYYSEMETKIKQLRQRIEKEIKD